MIRLRVGCVCVLLLIILQGSRVSAQLANLDFEDQDSNAWQFTTEAGVYDSIAHHGNSSLRLDGKKDQKNSFIQFFQPNTKTPTRLRLTGYMKYEGISDLVGLYAASFDSTKMTMEKMMEDVNLRGTVSGWSEYAVDIIVDEDSQYVAFGGHLSGIGKAWFDSYEYEVVERSDPSQEVEDYLNEFMRIVSENSIKSDEQVLTDLRGRVTELSQTTVSITQSHDVINYILYKLNDGHSRFRNVQMSDDWLSGESTDYSIKSKVINENIGYLEIPTFVSGNEESMSKYAAALKNSILEISEDGNIKGWIIDLRENIGGNAFAMIAGVSPLLKSGVLAYTTTKDGSKQEFNSESGMLYYGGSVVYDKLKFTNSTRINNVPIFVLTSTKTSSAAELLTIVLKGNANAKVIGEKTSGTTTNNQKFELADGSLLFLASGYFTDVNGKVYTDGINPDIESNDPIETAVQMFQK